VGERVREGEGGGGRRRSSLGGSEGKGRRGGGAGSAVGVAHVDGHVLFQVVGRDGGAAGGEEAVVLSVCSLDCRVILEVTPIVSKGDLSHHREENVCVLCDDRRRTRDASCIHIDVLWDLLFPLGLFPLVVHQRGGRRRGRRCRRGVGLLLSSLGR